jgi:hypothetical protein
MTAMKSLNHLSNQEHYLLCTCQKFIHISHCMQLSIWYPCMPLEQGRAKRRKRQQTKRSESKRQLQMQPTTSSMPII